MRFAAVQMLVMYVVPLSAALLNIYMTTQESVAPLSVAPSNIYIQGSYTLLCMSFCLVSVSP